VSALTTVLPLSAREAVATLTPAFRATSRIVTAFFVTASPHPVGFIDDLKPVT